MHVKYWISATVAGLALLASSSVVPALAQEQATPTPTPEQVTPTPAPAQVAPDIDTTPAPEQVTPTPAPTQVAPDIDTTPAPEQVTPTPAPTQVTPDAGTEDTSIIEVEEEEEKEEANQELSASDEEIEQLVNEGAVEEVAPNSEVPVTPNPEAPIIPNAEVPVTPNPEGLRQLQLAAPQSNRERALAVARAQIGYKETSQNCNKFSRYFGKGCQPWCADFVSWAFDSTGNRDKKLPWKNPSAVRSILQWAQTNNKLVRTPQRGDIFIMRARGVSHTGLVLRVERDGKTFVTVEGNSSNQVMTRRRSVTTYPYRFVRVPA